MENETFKIQWNFSKYTDQAIHHCRPNIVLIDKVDSRVKIIDKLCCGTPILRASTGRRLAIIKTWP